MKIVIKDNFNRDSFTEMVIAEKVNEFYGNEMVKLHNDRYQHEDSDIYLSLEDDNYICQNPYADYEEDKA